MFVTVLLVCIENMPLTVNERHHQMTFSVHFPRGVHSGEVCKMLEKRERAEEQI